MSDERMRVRITVFVTHKKETQEINKISLDKEVTH